MVPPERARTLGGPDQSRLARRQRNWSGRRDSNPRHAAWKAAAPPTELLPRRLIRHSPVERSKPMAVRADDIALRDFGQDARRARTPDHPRDRVPLVVGIAMVEVHCAGREVTPAVPAWHVAEPIQQPRLGTPHCPLAGQVAGRTARSGTFGVALPCAHAVAVGTDRVALANFLVQGGALQHDCPGSDSEGLERRVPMVEVHLVRRKYAVAVCTRRGSELAQVGYGRSLAALNSLDLTISFPPVVRDVGGALAPALRHVGAL